MSEENTHIWYHTESDSVIFYNIPEKVFFLPGTYQLERFDGVIKKVQPEELSHYRVDEEVAGQQLTAAYEAAIQIAKKQLKYLTRFAELTGKLEQFDKLIDDKASLVGMAHVQDFVRDFFGNLNQKASSQEAQQQLFKETFEKMPDIAAFFDKKSIEKAAKDPEAWANEMYKTMFGEEELKRQSQKKDQLKKTISEQLRKNVEEAEKRYKK